ncbi:MAG: DUF4317 domain-containing protein [Eubacterium sp.]|nr:DUF4317 domain-containing protein [Eubacterium sp.]
MNKKEVLEIRKLFAKDDCRLDRIAACYVDGHKNKVFRMKEAFLSLPDEEMFKYTEILKKALSGTVGKNLLNLEFPLAEEAPGGHQADLLALRDSELKDDAMIDSFFDKIVETYLYAENYLILLVHGNYDVPGKASDNAEMFDSSEYVYNFVLCCICPVSLNKAGLCYNAEVNTFVDKVQDWMLQNPEVSFLFPAFNDRNSDIHSLLYYSKNPEILHPEITDDLLGCTLPLPASDQLDTFNTIIEETFSNHCDFEVAKTVHEELNALLEGKKEEPEPTPLEKADIRRFLERCGADSEQIEHFDEVYDDDRHEDVHLLASNLANPKKFEVKSPDVKISVSGSRTDLIETRMIDGVEYIMIPVTDTVEVNGIKIRAGRSDQAQPFETES